MTQLADTSLVIDGKTLGDEYLEVLASQATRVPLPISVVAVIIASMASNHYPIMVWGGWILLVMLIMFVRWRVFTWLPGQSQIMIEKRIRITVMIALANGIIQAASVLFFAEFTITERTVLTLMFSGLVTGAVVTTAGHTPTFLAFSIPMLLSLAIVWGIYQTPGTGIWLQVGMPVLVIASGVLMTGLAARYSKFFTESFEIRANQKQLNAQLQDALNESITANQAKTRFLASASHDLRQPIHALSLFSAALSRRQLDDSTREIVSHMETAVDNLAMQMNALLDISKLDAGLVEPSNKPVDLLAYLQQLHAEQRPQAEEKGIELKLSANDNACVFTDKELFDRIIRNLLSNAIRYTDQGSVTLQLEDAGEQWMIRIVDTGRGIPEEEQALVYEEFYQSNNPHRDRSLGLGLGLAIVKRLSRMLGISTHLESKEGKGTSVSLSLPKYLGASASSEDTNGEISIAGIRVLCIDDESEIRAALQTTLGDMGCEVTTAASTQDAVSAAKDSRPDIIIADFRLAYGDDGLAAIQAIRTFMPAIPALLITGDTAPERLTIAAESGVPLLHKPIKADVMLSKVHEQLQQKAQGE